MFHYRAEKEKFDRAWKTKSQIYRQAGMDEDAIEKLREFDWEQEFCKVRNETNHRVDISLSQSADHGINIEQLLFSNGHYITIDTELFQGRYEWVEEIENATLAKRLKQLTHEDLELLTLYAIEGKSQEEIACGFGLSQRAISKRINKIKKLLENGSKK